MVKSLKAFSFSSSSSGLIRYALIEGIFIICKTSVSCSFIEVSKLALFTLAAISRSVSVHRYEADPDFKHWCIVREAQAKVSSSVRNAWLTSAFDLGQYSDIHPVAKKELAERMEKKCAGKCLSAYTFT